MKEDIKAAIKLLEENGYIVRKDLSNYIGKWIAFKQEGMECVLHGKVVKTSSFLTVKCKNSYYRFVNMKNVIGFYDDKKSCYAIK